MIRRMFVIVAATLVLVTVAGCDDDKDGWHPAAPFAPSLQPTFGVRVTDGQLLVSIGPSCDRVTKMTVSFDVGDPKLVLSSLDLAGVSVDRFSLGGPYPGLRVTTALPENFDWRDVEEISIKMLSEPGGFPGTSSVSEAVKGSVDHPADTYFYAGIGWLTEAEAAAQDGKTFLAPCTPDPKKRT